MNRTAVVIVLALAAGFAVGAWATIAGPLSGGDSEPGDAAVDFDATAPLQQRIAALERAVTEERDARLVLEEQLHGIYAELERFDAPEVDELLNTLAQNREAREEAQERGRVRRFGPGGRPGRMQELTDMRVGQFVEGGFTEQRARQILEMEDEARMAALQAEYDAWRDGESLGPWGQANQVQAALRERLGDADYEKYLTAQGGQASITVGEVLGASPANRAGLRSGDRILSYDGNRVFTMSELRSMAFSGDPGEDVIVDIERDGQRMQLVVPRGPMGITGVGGGMGMRAPFGG